MLLFFPEDEVAPGRIRIDGPRLAHLTGVLGVQPGQTLRVGAIDGDTGLATVDEIHPGYMLLRVDLTQPPPAKLPLQLVLALPRPKMLRRILRATAEFGVAELHLINSYRVEKSYWKTPALEPARVREYFIQGLEQARDTVLPSLHLHPRFKPFAEDQLPAMVEGRAALLAHPGDYPPCPRGLEGPVLLVIGPEGGFIPYEVEKLQQAGCRAVSLGPRILRVENAVTSLLGRLF